MIRSANDGMLQQMVYSISASENMVSIAGKEQELAFSSAMASFISSVDNRWVDPRLIVPSSGVQDGLDKLILLFLRKNDFFPGAYVYVEGAVPVDIARVFADRNVRIETLHSDTGGIDLNYLKHELEQHQWAYESREEINSWPMFLYLSPCHIQPLQTRMSRQRRADLMSLTRQFNLPVVINDEYGLLNIAEALDMLSRNRISNERFPSESRAHRPLVSDIGHSHVYSLSSFKQLLGSGINVGWVEAGSHVAVPDLRAMIGKPSSFTFDLVLEILKSSNLDFLTRAPTPQPHVSMNTLLSSLKHSMTKKYLSFTFVLMRYSMQLLPFGKDNGIFIEGYSSMNEDGNRLDQNMSTVLPLQEQDIDSDYKSGIFIWVRLPQWCQHIAMHRARAGAFEAPGVFFHNI